MLLFIKCLKNKKNSIKLLFEKKKIRKIKILKSQNGILPSKAYKGLYEEFFRQNCSRLLSHN